MEDWLTPRLGETVSNVSALILCAYLALSFFGASFIDRFGYTSNASLHQVRRAFYTRKFRGRTVVPVGTWASMKADMQQRIDDERTYYIVVCVVTLVISLFALIFNSSAIVRLYEMLHFNPFVFFGSACKIAMFFYRVCQPGVTVASALTLLAFCWAGAFVRLSLCFVLIAGYALPEEKAARFSFAYFSPFRFWLGTVTFRDGTTQEVEFMGSADPFRTAHSFMQGAMGVYPDNEARACYGYDIDDHHQGVLHDIRVVRCTVGDAFAAHLTDTAQILNRGPDPHDPRLFVSNPVGREVGVPLKRYMVHHRSYVRGTPEEVCTKFGLDPEHGVPARHDISIDFLWLNSPVRFNRAIFTMIAPGHYMVSIEGNLDLCEMNYGWISRMNNHLVQYCGFLLQKAVAEPTMEFMTYCEGIFDPNLDVLRPTLSQFPLGYCLSFIIVADVIEIAIGAISGYSSAFAFARWFKPHPAEHDLKPEAKTSCNNCSGPHLTVFCAKTKGVWTWISWAMNGSLVLGAALLACLLTARGFTAVRNIARGLKHGLAYVMDYKADALHIKNYSYVNPLFPADPDACPWINALLELSVKNEVYQAKAGIFNPISFNLLISTLKANPQTIVDEFEYIYQHAGSERGAKVRQDRMTIRSDKATLLGLQLFTPTNAVADYNYYSVADNWTTSLQAAFPGYNISTFTYRFEENERTGQAIHYVNASPVVVPKDNALFTAPADPETSFVDLFVMGWAGACAIGLPLGIYYLMRNFFDRNSPGTACSVCLRVERDHLDGKCVDFPVCPRCDTKSHRPGNCHVTSLPDTMLVEGKRESKRICRFSAKACADVYGENCEFTHRDFSVVSSQSIVAAAFRGARVVCLHHDRDTPCILKHCAAIVDRAALKVQCVEVPIDGKARPTRSVSIPPADIYFTPISVFDPSLTLLNLRCNDIEEEGKNDKGNYHYKNSARSLAHREDSRANNRRDNSKFHGSDDSNFFEFVSDDHEPEEWLEYVQSHRDQLKVDLGDIRDLERDLGASRGRGERQRVTVDFIYKNATGNMRKQVDKYMDLTEESRKKKVTFEALPLSDEAKKPAPVGPLQYCHDFANFRCSHGQHCRFAHIPFSQIPVDQRFCAYGTDPTCCPMRNCVFHTGSRPENAPVSYDPTKVVFLTRKPEPVIPSAVLSEGAMTAEAVVKSNPLISKPSVTPLEVSFQTDDACCSLYAWKLSDNNGAACFLAPYHLFGTRCPKPNEPLTVLFLSTTLATSILSLDCKFVASTGYEPYGTNAWKTAMCIFSCARFPQRYFPGVKTLTLVSSVINTATQVVLYPEFPSVAAAGLASPLPDGSLLTHTISMPEKVNDKPVLRCGRIIVSATGVVGFHVAGDTAAGVNYAYPIDRVVHLLSGCVLTPTYDLGTSVEEQGNNDRFDYLCQLLDLQFRPEIARPPTSSSPLDVNGALTGQCRVIGTCKRLPQTDTGYVFDIDFFFFMQETAAAGRYPNIVASYIEHCGLMYSKIPVVAQNWLQSLRYLPEAIYGTQRMFTHMPSVVPSDEVLEQAVLKFFRTTSVNQSELSAYFRVIMKPFFDACHEKRPYRFYSYDEAVQDMEERGNEYRSAGAGVTKNQAFRDPRFRMYVESVGEFIPVTTYVVSNKKELRTIGKTMRQFMVQDPVSYVKEIRWMRWFMDQIIEESLTGEFGACFFNTFSPFEGPAAVAQRAATRLNCDVSELWFWCFDASKSECNEFQYIVRELAQAAVLYGAPFQQVIDSVMSNMNPYFFDTNLGQVYQPKPDSTMSNASGAFHTTALTALLWGTAGGAGAHAMQSGEFRACVCNAGDDGVLCSRGDPRPHIHKFNDMIKRFGGKVEFEEAPYPFATAPSDSFNFCSVTCSTLDKPYTVVGKKTSALAWRLERNDAITRMQALDSYWLTSYFDTQLRDFIHEFRLFFKFRTSTTPHRFTIPDVLRIYKRTEQDRPIGLDRISLQIECSALDDLQRLTYLSMWHIVVSLGHQEPLETFVQLSRLPGARTPQVLHFMQLEAQGSVECIHCRQSPCCCRFCTIPECFCPWCEEAPCDFCGGLKHTGAGCPVLPSCYCCGLPQLEAQGLNGPPPVFFDICDHCERAVCFDCKGHFDEPLCEEERFCVCGHATVLCPECGCSYFGEVTCPQCAEHPAFSGAPCPDCGVPLDEDADSCACQNGAEYCEVCDTWNLYPGCPECAANKAEVLECPSTHHVVDENGKIVDDWTLECSTDGCTCGSAPASGVCLSCYEASGRSTPVIGPVDHELVTQQPVYCKFLELIPGDPNRVWARYVSGNFTDAEASSDDESSYEDESDTVSIDAPQTLGDCGREDRSNCSEQSVPETDMSTKTTTVVTKPSRIPRPVKVVEVPVNMNLGGAANKKKQHAKGGRNMRTKLRGMNARTTGLSTRAKLQKTDRLYTQNRATTKHPTFGAADANARKMARLVACPDEMENYDLESARVPTLPTASSARRHSHVAATMITTQMRNKGLIVQTPGQTTWAVRILVAAGYVGSFGVGDLLALNPARADFCWLNSDARTGALAPVVYTKKLTSGLHSGIMIGCDAEVPPAPVPVQFTATANTAYNGVYYMITDGAGNYTLARASGVVRFATMLLGDVTMQPAAGQTVSATHPVQSYSFVPNRSGGVQTTMYLEALPLTTGAIARTALCCEGSAEGPVGDASYFPYTPVCSNLRVISDASALKNKFAVTSFALSSGREGPFNSVVLMGPTTTSSGLLATPETLSQRARQQTIGSLNPDNDDWASCNLASRISGMHDDEPPGVFDAAYIGVTEPPNEIGTYSYVPAQGGDTAFQQANNTSADFLHYTISYTFFNNGDNTVGGTCPVQMLGRSFFEFSLPSDTGFMTVAPQYCAEFHSLLQTIGTYPTLATAHSFKDFLGSVWKRTKDGARSMMGKAGAILKPLAVHAGTELIRSLPELILAA